MKARRIPDSYLAIAIVVVLGAFGYGFYEYHAQNLALASADAEVASLESALATASSTNAELNASLSAAQAANNGFSSQISTLSSTVSSLNKLSQTDPQLLAKYSKVYFLNENYIPASLSPIPTAYTYPDGKDYEFLAGALPHLEDMLTAASSTGLSLEIISSYRSFGTQAALKSEYNVTYGTGANSFSAEQGYSEHQLGTAIDLTTPTVGATFTGFENTKEYSWLVANAYKYGFILSYPQGNSYYIYEPWHWRYVGVALATWLHENNEYFYDADQRTIDSYLVNFFD